MARVTGTITERDVLNLSFEDRKNHLTNLYTELQKRHGPGIFHTAGKPNGDLDWSFDYAEQFSPYLGLSAEQVEAIHNARVKMCNMSAVKLENGAYVAIDPNDFNAATTVRDINVLEELLAQYGRGTKSS